MVRSDFLRRLLSAVALGALIFTSARTGAQEGAGTKAPGGGNFTTLSTQNVSRSTAATAADAKNPAIGAAGGARLSSPTGGSGSIDQARSAGSSAQTGSMLAMVAGGITAGLAVKNFMACYACTPKPCMQFCTYGSLYAAGAVLSMVVSGNMNKAKQSADTTVRDLSMGGNPAWNDPTGTNIDGGTPSDRADGGDPRINQLRDQTIKTLGGVGVKVDVDKGTFTTKDGKTFKAQDIASGKTALPGIGGSAATAAAFQNAMTSAMKKANEQAAAMNKSKPIATDGGEEIGGGAAGGGVKIVDLPAFENPGLPSLGPAIDPNLGRDPASVAGSMVMVNGTPVGVAPDNIFKIICRRMISQVERGRTLEPATGKSARECDQQAAFDSSPAPR